MSMMLCGTFGSGYAGRNAEGSVPYGRGCKEEIRGKPADSFEMFCIVRRPESAQSLVGNAAPGVPKEEARESRKSPVVSPMDSLPRFISLKEGALDWCGFSVLFSSKAFANRQSVQRNAEGSVPYGCGADISPIRAIPFYRRESPGHRKEPLLLFWNGSSVLV